MLRIAFALIGGIVLSMALNREQLQTGWVLFFGVLVIASMVLSIIFNHLKNISLAFRLQTLNGIALTIAIFGLGYLITAFHYQKNYADYFSGFLNRENQLIVQIDEPPTTRDKVIMAIAEVLEVKSGRKIIQTAGRLQMSIVKDSLSENLRYGDVLLVRAKIDSIERPMNPDAFDYKSYLGFQNISYKAFLSPASWKLLQPDQGNSVLGFIYHIRASFLAVLKKYVSHKNNFEVASAIMLGYNDYGPEVRRAYASSGTLHVLSVSGLHVGIIFFMLNFLLQWMNTRGRKAEISKTAIIISFIWFYACLTGMSPPVLRSAIMFSFIQIGKTLIRNVNMYNIIAGSAVLMLLYNPFVLADVGFELSYIAVFGIVFLYPKFSVIIELNVPERKSSRARGLPAKFTTFFSQDWKWLLLWIMNWIWQLIAVSIAAQIATLPLCLLYFYQFPNLFLISNLIVIPVSNFVLFSGTALFAFSHIPYMNNCIGFIFSHLLMLLDKYIFWTDTLPFALTHDLSITACEMILLYLLIILICSITEKAKPGLLIASLVVVLSLCSFHSYRAFNNHIRRQIVVYDVPKQKAIAFLTGEKVAYDFDTALWNNYNEMAFSINHHWANCGIKDKTPLEAQNKNIWQYDFGKLIWYEGKKILIADSAISAKTKIRNPLKIDMLIVSGSPKISISQLKNLFDFKQVVFDSSNNYRKVRGWKSECDDLQISCWDVRLQGAYVYTINQGPQFIGSK
jgi:competence protein ComEC